MDDRRAFTGCFQCTIETPEVNGAGVARIRGQAWERYGNVAPLVRTTIYDQRLAARETYAKGLGRRTKGNLVTKVATRNLLATLRKAGLMP